MSDTGRFTWYELLTTDPTAARDFYRQVVGWEHAVWPGEMHYETFTLGGTPVAGVMQLPEAARQAGAPPHWMGYVCTEDLGDTAARIGRLGGRVLNQMAIDSVGRIAIVADPQGAMFAAFQPEEAPQPEHDPRIGEFSWHELATDDYAAAFDFYAGVFGWEVIADDDMGEFGVYRIFGRNGRQLGGMFNRSERMPACAWLYYVRVPDCDAAAERIGQLGGRVVNGPMEVPGGDRIVQALDPQGGMFALHSTATAAVEA